MEFNRFAVVVHRKRPTSMQLRCIVLPILFAVLSASLGRLVWADDHPLAGLAFHRAANELRFDTGVLQGTLGEGGKSLGLRPVRHVPSGVQIAGMFGILSPYRLLTADARFGTAAWDWTSRSEVLADGAARVHWPADKNHPLEMTGVYRWSANDTLDLELTVNPRRDLRRFELFLASYFHGFPTSLAYVRQAGTANGPGRFMKAEKAGGDWQAFPRDDAAAKIVGDGRWRRPPHPVTWTIMPRYAAPLAVRRDAVSGLAAVLMARPCDCFAVSMPYGGEGHGSVYLSLFGRDLKAGQKATATARLVIGKDISDDKAVELYRTYVKLDHGAR
jgi:hypothetical protein